MSSLSIQFYATTAEVARLAESWIRREGLHAATVEYRPYSATPIVPGDIALQLRTRLERASRLLLAERPVDCSATGNGDLLDKNEGALIVELGRHGSFGLTESHLSTMSVSRAWRNIAADLKKNTTAGMVGTQQQSGASATYRSLRYTTGAATLAEAGIPLRPFEQSPVLCRPIGKRPVPEPG